MSSDREISPLAGRPAPAQLLIDVGRLEREYHERVPEADNPAERVAFGTSGHRGSSLRGSFNEAHILAISQAICLYRKQHQIDGPLFLGMDTHALSVPALASSLEVLAANGVEVMIAEGDEYTPTPAMGTIFLMPMSTIWLTLSTWIQFEARKLVWEWIRSAALGSTIGRGLLSATG